MVRARVSRRRVAGVAIALLGLVVAAARAGPEGAPERADGAAGVEFFEREVRPLLVSRCQECHGPAKVKGGLRLDSRAAVLAGGRSGPAVVPGQPDESLLIDAINHGDVVRMPPKAKLPDREIAALTRWVAIGAPWSPHDAARPSSARARPSTSSDAPSTGASGRSASRSRPP